MHLPVGTLLQGGRYEILRYISSGGFGCTYEARNVVMDCNVAIKEFFVKDFCNRDKDTNHVVVATENKKALINRLRRKFIEEARALFRMRHPNIVRVTEMFEENNTAYYVMDYIDGQSLASLVEQQGRLSENTALDYIHQVGAALSYVHGSGRLHLDVKPGNIMIDQSGKAVLIDFGVSKQYDEVSGENTSTLMGHTPGYAPLEQTNNGIREFSPTTDIYSLGATLYKLVTGQTPPNASDVYEDGLPALPQEISAPVCVAIEAAMQPRRKDRPQSVAEFLKLLENGGKSRDERAKSKAASFDNTSSDKSCAVQTPFAPHGSRPASVVKAERFDNIGSDRSCAVQTQFAPHGSRPASVVKAESFDNIGSDSSSTPPFEKVGELSNGVNDSEETLANSSSTPRGEESRSDGGESKLKPENKKSNLPLIIIILLLSVILGAGGYLLFSSGNETENTTPDPPQVEPKKETTSLYVTTFPSGADVYIDGKHIGKTPIGGKEIEQGEHTIKIEKESYNPYEKIYTFGSDNIELYNIQLSKATTPLYITTTPRGADVYIDGKYIGTTPISGKKIEQGEHTVKIEKEEYNALTKKYTFEATPLVINEVLTRETKPTPAVDDEVLTEKTKPAPVVDNSFKTRTFTVNGVEFKMVAVEGGTFQMGATSEQENPEIDENPVHSVTLSDYYIGETEVTQALWQAVMGSNPSYFTGNPQRPVENVSCKDCETFINKLNSLLANQLPNGRKFRFPTEAQWEYAARGGNRSRGYQYSGSNNIKEVAWYDNSSSDKTHPVKQKQPNELGLYDMSGNVYEWCYDWYDKNYYSNSPQTNPEGPSSGSFRVLRGGCWCNNAQSCRVAIRNSNYPDGRYDLYGLRLAF